MIRLTKSQNFNICLFTETKVYMLLLIILVNANCTRHKKYLFVTYSNEHHYYTH